VRKNTYFAFYGLFVIFCTHAEGQPVEGGTCRPVNERTQDVGCWIVSNESIGELAGTQTFWHLDTFATPDAAAAAKTKRSTIVQALGKTWLLTIEDATWHASGGEHVTTIGPLPIAPGAYAAQYM